MGTLANKKIVDLLLSVGITHNFFNLELEGELFLEMERVA